MLVTTFGINCTKSSLLLQLAPLSCPLSGCVKLRILKHVDMFVFTGLVVANILGRRLIEVMISKKLGLP
jgi:hypothetical protein